MSPDPSKAIYVKKGQRKLRREKRRKSEWTEHKQDVALDAWGELVRDMKAKGAL